MAVYKSKTPTKDGRKYFFRIKYKDILGITHDYTSPKYLTKKDAENEEATYRIKVQNKEVSSSMITLNEAFNEFIIKHSNEVKYQTILRIKDRYEHLSIISNFKINDLDLKKYNLLIESLRSKNLSVSYINRITSLLKTIISFSNKYYNTSDKLNKFIVSIKDTALKKEMDFYTYNEYLKYNSVIEDHNWHTFFEILYFMGLRQGELCAINWNDINFEKKELSINKTLTTKIKGKNYVISTPKTKNSIRTLPIPDKVLKDLKMMYNNAIQYKDYSKEWFVFGNSIPFKETTICNQKNKYCKTADLKQIRIHDFRHSCASFLINQGASIALVSKYLGHSSISITLDTYTHMYKNELIDITNMINNINI